MGAQKNDDTMGGLRHPKEESGGIRRVQKDTEGSIRDYKSWIYFAVQCFLNCFICTVLYCLSCSFYHVFEFCPRTNIINSVLCE